MLVVLALAAIVAIYFLSGIKKIGNIDGTAHMISQKIPSLVEWSGLITLLIIAFEILAPILIVYAAVTGDHTFYAYASALALTVFTLVATAMFYFPPTGDNMSVFLLHISLAGAMYLVARTFH